MVTNHGVLDIAAQWQSTMKSRDQAVLQIKSSYSAGRHAGRSYVLSSVPSPCTIPLRTNTIIPAPRQWHQQYQHHQHHVTSVSTTALAIRPEPHDCPSSPADTRPDCNHRASAPPLPSPADPCLAAFPGPLSLSPPPTSCITRT